MKTLIRARTTIFMKAQAAVEYVVIIGVVLSIAITIFYFAMSYFSESVALSKAKESAEAVARNVDYVYSLGEGTRTTVSIDLPNNIIDSTIAGNEIIFKISTSAGKSDVYATAMTGPTGELPKTPGRHFLVIENIGDSVVIQ